MFVCCCILFCNVISTEGRWHHWLLLTVSFIVCVLCDYENFKICTILTIYTCVVYRWCNYVYVSLCAVTNLSILSYWIIACASVLHVYYVCIQMWTVYGCLSLCKECLYHYTSLLMTLKDHSVILCNIM